MLVCKVDILEREKRRNSVLLSLNLRLRKNLRFIKSVKNQYISLSSLCLYARIHNHPIVNVIYSKKIGDISFVFICHIKFVVVK